MVSSMYCKIQRPSYTKCGIRPDICPSSLALDISKANISATRLKSKGDKLSPLLNLSLFKNTYLLIRSQNDDVRT
jgi:hypothetical protein